LPTTEFDGRAVITAGPGAIPFEGFGDACWLQGLWWYGTLAADDPLARPTYDMISQSLTGKYTFNNAWMGVYAAKLRDGDAAYSWTMRGLQPAVNLFDDTALGEIVVGLDDFKKTPEIGAHAAVVCSVAQMLLDADDGDQITVFPAIPEAWRRPGVGFSGLAAYGGVVVSAQFTATGIEIGLLNRSRTATTRRLRVSLPEGTRQLAHSPEGTRVEDGWATLPHVTIPPGRSIRLQFTSVEGEQPWIDCR